MNKPLIWITSAVAGIGFGIPAYAAMSSQSNDPAKTPTSTVVSTPERGDDTTTVPSTPTSATNPQVTTPSMAPVIMTATSVEDISGPCDEAEHATDDRCTGVDAGNGAGADDNSGRGSSGSGHDGTDDADHSGHGGGNDD